MKRRRLEALFEDQMMEMGTLEDDEALKEALSDREAVPFRLSEHDCEDVQEIEAEVQAAVEKIWGECEMNKESIHWMIDCRKPQPPPPLDLLSAGGSREATIGPGGGAIIYGDDRRDCAPLVRTRDLRGLIASLQSILVLAEEHFGEEWGR